MKILTGIARYIRSGVLPSMENIALWHERDISHSSVERIMAPDITIATDFALSRLTDSNSKFNCLSRKYEKKFKSIRRTSQKSKYSSSINSKRLSRQEAYSVVQSSAMKSWNSK